MEPLKTIGEAVDAIRQFERDKFDALPAFAQCKLDELAGPGWTVADRIVGVAELLYAFRGKLTRKADRRLAARLVELATISNWHGLQTDGRGDRIKATMLAEAGVEGFSVPDDEPLPRFDMVEPILPSVPAR